MFSVRLISTERVRLAPCYAAVPRDPLDPVVVPAVSWRLVVSVRKLLVLEPKLCVETLVTVDVLEVLRSMRFSNDCCALAIVDRAQVPSHPAVTLALTLAPTPKSPASVSTPTVAEALALSEFERSLVFDIESASVRLFLEQSVVLLPRDVEVPLWREVLEAAVSEIPLKFVIVSAEVRY